MLFAATAVGLRPGLRSATTSAAGVACWGRVTGVKNVGPTVAAVARRSRNRSTDAQTTPATRPGGDINATPTKTSIITTSTAATTRTTTSTSTTAAEAAATRINASPAPLQQGTLPKSDIAAASATAQATSSSAPPAATAAGYNGPMDWTTFFKLRRSRRLYQLVFSGVAALGFGFGGALFLASEPGEKLMTLFPLDPFLSFGIGMAGFLALGWLIGPVLGEKLFYALNRRVKKAVQAKEQDFFVHIRRRRVDPTAGSASNPVPDYHGERIQSVQDYRRWCRDQRAFDKKRKKFL